MNTPSETMIRPCQVFHLISYLQYPFMLVATGYYIPFVISLAQRHPDWGYLNYALLLFGVALSFSTLQDTAKTQNKFSKKIWESPEKGRMALLLLAMLAFGFIACGLLMHCFSSSEVTSNIAVGVIVLGIGFVGVLKSGIEMFENHRKDKNITQDNPEHQDGL
ncbi:hypothetical protein [Sinomicrobium oceani]|nr:hypothetical protein [Sinomicrobium oceani]